MRSGKVRLWPLVILLGLAGCGGQSQELPPEYGEQVLTPKTKVRGPRPVPNGMESAESRSERPAP